MMSNYVSSIHTISFGCALVIAQKAVDKAADLQKSVAIEVLDASGNSLVSFRMDLAPTPCAEIAHRKAKTALAFGTPTRVWEERFPTLSAAVQQGLPLQAGLAFFGGGEPIIINGSRYGSIGVSGASEEQDCVIARAALEPIEGLVHEA